MSNCFISAKGTTALHLASMKGHKEVVTVLLNHAADINATTTDVSSNNV